MIWRRSEIDLRKQYRLLLYEGNEGERLYSLIDDEQRTERLASSSDVLLTEVVPSELLLRGDLIGISERVLLEGGGKFFVDAHGLWFTAAEAAQFESGVDMPDMIWSTKKVPRFEPY